MAGQKFTVTLIPKKVVYFLGTIVIFLVAAHVIGLFMRYGFGHGSVYRLVPLFDLDREENIPTLFSSCLFLINAVLFFITWKFRKVIDKHQWIWLFLLGLFSFLAIDEFAEIHEKFMEPVRLALDTSGFLYFAWVIPYSIAGLFLSTFLIPFFLQIDKKLRSRFAVSALIYIAGAIGFEMISAKYFSTKGPDIVYGFIIAFEESLEMIGLIALIYAQLSLIQSKYREFLIILSSASGPSNTINKPLIRIGKTGTD